MINREAASRSLVQVAGIVAAATLLSKGMGFVRQFLVAAIFGSGPEYSAFAVAYVIPSFLLILLGGINGPFHSAVISILKKREGEDASDWLESITTLVGLLLLLVVALLWLGAGGLVQIIAPGASSEVHRLAAMQLRIMAPLAVLAGLIGIGFGTLNAAGQYMVPALSPLLSSLTVIIALLLFGHTGDPLLLAWGTLAGAICQWVVQVPLQARLNLGKPRLRFNWTSPEVKAVGLLMLPAVVSSGMVHINVYVDMFFASYIPGDRTIGNLGYAQLLVQTPIGILSNMVLVTFMPVYAQLAVPERWQEFRQRIRQGMVVTALMSLPLSMILVVLAQPLVQIAYERGRFTPEITQEVAALLSAYGIGMVFYLLRDVVVRIYYALEDGRTPLMVSGAAIGLNAVFDGLGIRWFGAPGLALATAAVNLVALIWLALVLQKRLQDIPWSQILGVLAQVTLMALTGALVTWGCWRLWQGWQPSELLILNLGGTTLAAILGLGTYILGVGVLQIPEVEEVKWRLQRLLKKFYPSE
jgi:putative peptidoglycan lipid II flippase